MQEDPKQRTHVFRVQHRELLEVVQELDAQLDVAKLTADASQARALLSKLAGKLAVHLAMEDKGLYPRLLNHRDTRIRELASQFVSEMSGIHEAFAAYIARWPTAQAIQADGTNFERETKQIFATLGDRIDREHGQLFPALDET